MLECFEDTDYRDIRIYIFGITFLIFLLYMLCDSCSYLIEYIEMILSFQIRIAYFQLLIPAKNFIILFHYASEFQQWYQSHP